MQEVASLGGMAGGYVSPYAISVLVLCAEGAQAPNCPSDRIVAAAFLAWSEIHTLANNVGVWSRALCDVQHPGSPSKATPQVGVLPPCRHSAKGMPDLAALRYKLFLAPLIHLSLSYMIFEDS